MTNDRRVASFSIVQKMELTTLIVVKMVIDVKTDSFMMWIESSLKD
jgi:hypothetical protein